MLTHYRLRKLEAQNLGLTSGEPGELAGLTAAGSSQPREVKYGLLQDVIDRINELFAGTGVDETSGVDRIQSLLHRVVENEKLQAEAMANTEVDFASSPTIVEQLEDLIYTSANGHNDATRALLQLPDLAKVVPVLLAMDIYEKLRAEAERAAS